MFIDIIFCILMVVAIFKGFSQGLVVALFSLIAYIIGLAAAIKLSAVVATYLQSSLNVSGKFLPILSFILVFVGIIILVRLVAGIIKKTLNIILLGWLDKLGGFVLYALMYTFIFSVILFYADQINLISDEAKTASVTFNYVAPLGPKVINAIGAVIPFFSDMFTDLKNFFGGVAEQNQ